MLPCRRFLIEFDLMSVFSTYATRSFHAWPVDSFIFLSLFISVFGEALGAPSNVSCFYVTHNSLLSLDFPGTKKKPKPPTMPIMRCVYVCRRWKLNYCDGGERKESRGSEQLAVKTRCVARLCDVRLLIKRNCFAHWINLLKRFPFQMEPSWIRFEHSDMYLFHVRVRSCFIHFIFLGIYKVTKARRWKYNIKKSKMDSSRGKNQTNQRQTLERNCRHRRSQSSFDSTCLDSSSLNDSLSYCKFITSRKICEKRGGN